MTAYYTIIMGMVVFAMTAMVICVNTSGTLSRSKKHYFRLLFTCIAVAAFCEWFGIALQGTGPSTRVLHIAVKAIELSIAPGIAFLIAAVIDLKYRKAILSLLAVHSLLEISSGIWGFIYKVDANSNYTHERFYWIYIAAYISAILYVSYIIIRNMRKYQYNGFAFFFLISIFMLTGIVVQLINSELKVVYPAIAIEALMLYIFTLEMIQQTDALTGLINRRGYENCIAHLEDTCVILMFDIDKFKAVNDDYGHKFGDLCLKEAGNALKSTYAKYGKCFRIGGDEFCVIVTKGTDQIKTINQRFFAEIAQCREKYTWMPWVSMGYVFYNPQTDRPQDMVAAADAQMYQFKEAHRSPAEPSN